MTALVALGGLAVGLVVGAISGTIGIGGGAFLIPALILFYGMSQKTAQGTSIATLVLPIGFFAFWTYYKAELVDIKLALLIAVGFAIGGWVGGLWGAAPLRGRPAWRLRVSAFRARCKTRLRALGR